MQTLGLFSVKTRFDYFHQIISINKSFHAAIGLSKDIEQVFFVCLEDDISVLPSITICFLAYKTSEIPRTNGNIS